MTICRNITILSGNFIVSVLNLLSKIIRRSTLSSNKMREISLLPGEIMDLNWVNQPDFVMLIGCMHFWCIRFCITEQNSLKRLSDQTCTIGHGLLIATNCFHQVVQVAYVYCYISINSQWGFKIALFFAKIKTFYQILYS